MGNSEIIKMLKNTPIVPVFTPMMPKDCWGVIKTCSKLDQYMESKWPAAITQLKNED